MTSGGPEQQLGDEEGADRARDEFDSELLQLARRSVPQEKARDAGRDNAHRTARGHRPR